MFVPHRIFATLVAALIVTTGLRAELKFEAEINGRHLPITGVEHHSIYAAAGSQKIALPSEPTLLLEGDLRANADAVRWSPSYTISRADVPDRERDRTPKPYRAEFRLRHDSAPAGRKQPVDEFTRAWPGGTREPAIAVFAWVVGGRVTELWAHPIPATTSGRAFDLGHSFSLSADAARGELVVLLWAGGHFVPAEKQFTVPAAEAAFLAVELDDVAGLRAALAAGAKPDARDVQGVPLLQYAAEAGARQCVDALLSAGAQVNDHGPVGTPLAWGAANGRAAVVDRLLAAKARPDLNSTSALQSAISGGHEDIAVTLIHAGANPDAQNALYEAPVVAALNAGMARAVALLDNGAGLDLRNEQAPRVLASQAKLGHTAVVQLLLARDVRPDEQALIAGAVSGDPLIAKALIARGAKPDDIGPNGATALMVAASDDRAQYAETLLAAGAHPNLATAKGATALHLAASSNAAKVARVLLQHGADPTLRLGHSTALDIALAVHARETAAVLAAGGAKIDRHSDAAKMELERALEYDLAPLISAAIADGWSPNTTLEGWPALDLARVYQAKRCAEVLEHAGARLDASAPMVGHPGELDHGVRPVKLFRPEDPRTSEDHFPAAHVDVEALVDRDGTPRFVRLVKADDFSLATPAIEAISQWRFAPAEAHHKPVPLLVQIPLVFPSSEMLWPDASDIDVEPQVTHQTAPEYPDDLRSRGYTGTVVLRFLVNTAGHTERIHVVSTSHPELSQAAIEAVARWTFKPGQLDGKPVATWLEVPIVFTLY